jgi:type IV secretory pathway TraG/TraD family ATPase VirD4
MTTGTLILFLVLAAASWLAWRVYWRRLVLGLAAAAILPALTISQQIGWPLVGLAVAVAVGVVVWHRWSRSAATVTRWGARTRRKSGVASTVDVARFASAAALRRRAGTVRPSLAGLSWSQRMRLPAAAVGVELCRVGVQKVYASVEDVTLAFGGPRTGKSGWIAGRILDAPGAALVTSTRTDLYQRTAELRGQVGPVFVFNAAGLAGLPSTITFDPLTGCTDPVTAAERATDMIGAATHAGGGGGAGEREFWAGQARRVLAGLLHAAALGGHGMREVLGWVADPDAGEREITSLLRKSSEPSYGTDVAQFIGTNARTRTSITSTIMPALGWLTSPAACAAAQGGQPFDVAHLLHSRATVYLLGAEEAQTAPLVCALTGHIAREARRIAARQRGGRLDPPLSMHLDEAALISPVPLQSWTADMGGRGVCITAAFQSRAQLLDRYGEAKAAVILNNAGAKVLFGGTTDRDDLIFWSTLAGDRDERITTTDLHGRVASRTVRKVPVLAPAQLANLPTGRVVVFRRGIAPVIGTAQMVWRRRDVRAHDRTQAGATGWAARLRAMAANLRIRRTRPAPAAAPTTVTATIVRDVEVLALPAAGSNGSGNGAHSGRWNQ